MRVLLTGFGPFPGAPHNPSGDLAKALARRRRPALAAVKRSVHVFATIYASIDRELPALLAKRPDVVLMFGLAGRRRQLCIETRARNAVSVIFPDASGHRPPCNIIARGEPQVRKAAAPSVRLLAAVRQRHLPARLSRDAGRYLCNYAYWRALQRVRGGRPLVQFIHIPPVRHKVLPRRQSGRRGPSLADLVAAAEAVLIALIAATRR